jgi:hypothetical protein
MFPVSWMRHNQGVPDYVRNVSLHLYFLLLALIVLRRRKDDHKRMA